MKVCRPFGPSRRASAGRYSADEHETPRRIARVSLASANAPWIFGTSSTKTRRSHSANDLARLVSVMPNSSDTCELHSHSPEPRLTSKVPIPLAASANRRRVSAALMRSWQAVRRHFRYPACGRPRLINSCSGSFLLPTSRAASQVQYDGEGD